MPKQKLIKSLLAVQILLKLFDECCIKPETQAREVYNEITVFYENSELLNFRTCFSKLKNARFGSCKLQFTGVKVLLFPFHRT